MKLKLHTLYLVIALLSFPVLYSQTSGIKGVVLEEKTGQPLPGATVTIKGVSKSKVTGAEGTFMFSKVAPGAYEITVTAMGFQEKEVTEVIVVADEITDLTISLEAKSNQLDEVVIKTTRAKTESVKSLLTQQKNAATVSDGISAETIKRTPDKSTSDVLKRISGASIQDNRFVIVRGLNDRYNASFLNGAPLPSTESDRKAFSFDIFPSNMLDNIVITKTASPDLPGDFAGGVVQINTKSVPEKDFESITIGAGYNTVTTFKKQRISQGSSTDWLGYDNGTRALPSSFPSTDYFTSATTTADDRANIAKNFKTDWSIRDGSFKPNTNFQYSIGRHFDFKDKVFGVLFSLTNNKTNTFEKKVKYDYDNPVYEDPSTLVGKLNENRYIEKVLSAALANFSLKFNENNSISFKNIYSINSTNLLLEGNTQADVADPRITLTDTRWFTSNKIYSGTLSGEHYFTKPKVKINWTGFYSNVNRSIPNLRRNMYTIANPNSTDPTETVPYALIASNNGGPDYGGGMFFSENKETIKGGKLDLSKKFNFGEESINEIKVGGFYQVRDRNFRARQLQYNTYNTLTTSFNYDLLTLPNATIFNQANMGDLGNGQNGFTLYDATKVTDAYLAGCKLNSAYVMFDNRYKKFRLVWGARIEDYTQTLHSRLNESERIDQSKHQTDFLPSVNFIYSVSSKQNIRVSFSKTLNRPEFRELAPFAFYDFDDGYLKQGNPNLKIASVQNFDLRYEVYPGKGQMFTVSYFSKKFTNPIEIIQQINNKTITYENANSAKNSGFEFEFRTLLSSLIGGENSAILDDVTLFSNIAIIRSKVDVSNVSDANPEKSRPLQGQSPYVLNAGAQYINKDNGWAVSMNVNRVGNRIVFGSSEVEPSLWEKARTFLDLQIAKNLYKNKIEVKLNVQNILAQDLVFYQNKKVENPNLGNTLSNLTNLLFTSDPLNENGFNSKVDDVAWRIKNGRTFSLAFTYNF
jgi:hypothetical protein